MKIVLCRAKVNIPLARFADFVYVKRANNRFYDIECVINII